MKDQSNFSLTFSRSSRFEEFLGCRVVIGLDLVPTAVKASILISDSNILKVLVLNWHELQDLTNISSFHALF